MFLFSEEQKLEAIQYRNSIWANCEKIPKWVDVKTVDLDQFFTRPEIAEYCYKNLLSIINAGGENETHYKFIEPSVGWELCINYF